MGYIMCQNYFFGPANYTTGPSQFQSFLENSFNDLATLCSSSITISLLLAATIVVFRGLPYYNLFGPIYQAISYALACKVLRVMLLCERDLVERREIETAEVEIMLAAAIARGTTQNIVVGLP